MNADLSTTAAGAMPPDATPTPPDAGPSWPVLTAAEARVLGALIEKELTTPDYYPLTLNALAAACNQKNNRNPVTSLDESTVLGALDTLREKKLAWQVFLAGNRVPKFRHAFTDVYHVPDETVPLFCELLLRGPQTAAELRSRTERMRATPLDADTEMLLQQLASHQEGPFVVRLARESGRRESRYGHLLCGPLSEASVTAQPTGADSMGGSLPQDATRLAQMAEAIADLQARVRALEAKLEQFLSS